MLSKTGFKWAAAVVIIMALLVAGAAMARPINTGDPVLKPQRTLGQTRHTLDTEYTQLRYIKTTDYGATWSELTQAGDLSTFAPTEAVLPEFSAVTTAANEICFAVVLHNAATPGAYSMTGPSFTPVLAMAEGDNAFDVGYDPAGGGRVDIGSCPNGDLIMIIWGHNAAGENTLWAVKSTTSGASWGTPYVVANEALIGAEDAANFSHMFHISDRNSATHFFVIFQKTGETGYDQYVLRCPTAGGMGTVTDVGEYAGHFFSYMFGASKPIAYDPEANALFITFFNYNRTGAFVFYSNNGGQTFTFQANTGVAGSRYPGIALRPDSPTSGTPFMILNMTISMPVGQRACVYQSYDELGYDGGSWIAPDSIFCITRDDFSSTGSVCYVNEQWFWDATHGIATFNSWDEPARGEKLITSRSTDGGVTWIDAVQQWNYLLDTLDAATMQNAEVIGGSNGVAYAITCAMKGLTDLTPASITGTLLLGDYMTTGPWAVKAHYDDNVGIDTTRAWVNWSCATVQEGAETSALRDSAWIEDVEKQSGWYFFTIPSTNADGNAWVVGDTIDFYCDAYDLSSLYNNDLHQLLIVGTAYLDSDDPSVPAVAREFRLMGNYPNPFNPTTRIMFSLPTDQPVTLKVFNTLGQVVATLADHRMVSAGLHYFNFDASSLSSGVYFYTLEAGPHYAASKMVLMK
ncbi:T9SS C-terminal target domain-containing protein [candidate division KSB1 bacterium]|nr:MAG: T9SS C-terminal target domain-containing protein [candidate division KSB1 bacterium]